MYWGKTAVKCDMLNMELRINIGHNCYSVDLDIGISSRDDREGGKERYLISKFSRNDREVGRRAISEFFLSGA